MMEVMSAEQGLGTTKFTNLIGRNTRRHFHQRVEEHKRSGNGKHLEQKHDRDVNTFLFDLEEMSKQAGQPHV